MLRVRAPADFDWSAASAAVVEDVAKWLTAYRADDVVHNVDALRRDEVAADGDDAARARSRALWRALAAEDSLCVAVRAVLLRLREVRAGRARAYDPRLDEVLRIATAFERLWRARLGDERFDDWLANGPGLAAGEPGETFGARVGRAADGARRRGATLVELGKRGTTTRWFTAARLAWARVADVCDEVVPHVTRLTGRDRHGDEADAAARANMVELVRRLSALSEGARALAERGW